MDHSILDAVVDEIGRLGGRVDEIRQAKGAHRMIYWTTQRGVKSVLTVPNYNGNWRSLANARGNVRRAARL